MERERRLSLVVGIFVVGVLAVLAAAILSLTSERGFWTARYRLVAHFENVQGLVEGAPVRLAGTDVGTVEFISFAALDAGQPPVRVVLLIDEAVKDRIRTDSVASIGTIGLLGDKYIEIGMGTSAGEALADGADLASRSPLDLNDVVARGTEAIDSIATLAGNVNRVVEDFGRHMGGAGMAESVTAVSEIAREIQEGDGLLHSLIYDRYEGSGVESIERSLAIVEEILEAVAHGDGVLHDLIYGSPAEEDIVTQAVQAGARMNRILDKIDRGEGTLGLLLNDPTLYEDLKLLVGGAQRSLVVRSLVRMASDGGR